MSERQLPPARVRTRPSIPAESLEPAGQKEPSYTVGYGKPPAGSRFKPGQSGNPNGRPKGSRSISTILTEELDKPITARIGGRSVTMSRRHALVTRFLEQALGGDLRATALLLKLDGAGGEDRSETQANQPDPLSPAQAVLLERYLEKLRSEGEP